MSHLWRTPCNFLVFFSLSLSAQQAHDHPAPEKLGAVSFPITCAPAVKAQFNRGVALLHSFAYSAAESAFKTVAENDPQCAMAQWGIAMTHFHQLWEPQLSPVTIPIADSAVQRAQTLGTNSERENAFIHAVSDIYRESSIQPLSARLSNYENAMRDLAADNSSDPEAQVFYALALLANASAMDKSHARQKQAADLLEPLYRTYPRHPGIAHYLIHAYDNTELAPRGLPAARAYREIAPSAPHALHMPSHIFTRLGLWDDSVASNLAARKAARDQGDVGEELHAMDYLVYAYLQSSHDAEAAQIVGQLKEMSKLNGRDFKVGYASTAMPARYAVERKQWNDAAAIVASPGAPSQVMAVAVWARGIGLAHTGRQAQALVEIDNLRQIENQLRDAGSLYWAAQASIQMREVMAWSASADARPEEAVALLRQAADDEDSIEKLPVTPGPIVPAREQLGYLLLEQKQPHLASKEFAAALASSPGRKGALQGAAQAAEAALR